MSIHVLGTGAVGCHIASVLKSNKLPVTLLLRSQSHLNDFRSRQNTIIYRSQGHTSKIAGFEASVVGDTTDRAPIQSLIVATKGHHTLKALAPMASRLTAQSTILLLQNGMGVAEELMESLWPNSTPPAIFVGVNRHAVERMGPYDITHHSGYADPDALRIGRFSDANAAQPELVSKLVAIPELNAAQLPWNQVLVKMYKKLVINACINAVASVLMCKNIGNIKNGNPSGIALMRSICQEAHDVFKDDLPGETVDSLMDMVLACNRETGENVCSTLQDIRSKNLTEIDYLNGYICKKGQERGIDVRYNQAMVYIIHAKEALYE
ncbi:2-dehydropantoate 2-reductase [Mucor ambiguus]|uniref:2-dehydropantoate 2-reductase n=1 Tax=Mucor ambiguus TaxID=91626 RepID=A0A0C9M5J3_9FUNG|nr:2-dehydropantoate 2-reductase [Mucor ambiguus]